MSILNDRTMPNPITDNSALNRYPRKDERIRIIVHQKKKDVTFIGTFTGKVVNIHGAVLGFWKIDGMDKQKSSPWTRDRSKVEFYLAA